MLSVIEFKKDLCKILKNPQHAYLRERQMHTAIRKLKKAITLERLANRGWCAVKLEFSKAFDRVDRSPLVKILKGLNLDEFSIRTIETLYLDSKTVIEIKIFFNQPASKVIAMWDKVALFSHFCHSLCRTPSSINWIYIGNWRFQVNVPQTSFISSRHNLPDQTPMYWQIFLLNRYILQTNSNDD